MKYLVGIDEVGRGPIAGPVTIGAVLVRADFDMSLLDGIRDSKQLTPNARREWISRIEPVVSAQILRYIVVSAPASLIDRKGITHAITTTIYRSLSGLAVSPDETHVMLDGSLKAQAQFSQETIIKGDETVPLISLASIVAKVRRDALMDRLDRRYPGYGFEIHKGYGTKAHYAAIDKLGLSPVHRASFIH
jgi:ribonuclease HII